MDNISLRTLAAAKALLPGGGGGSSTAVDYGHAQSLTDDQKEQARNNIDAARGGARHLAQTKTETLGRVDLTDYTSFENSYITPCDGYLQLRNANNTNSEMHVDKFTLCTAKQGQTSSIFCAEGFHVWVAGNPSAAEFIPWKHGSM